MTGEVEFGDEPYYTMDSYECYEAEKFRDNLDCEDEFWLNEDALQLDGIPEALRSGASPVRSCRRREVD